MKKILIFIIMIILSLSLCGCSGFSSIVPGNSKSTKNAELFYEKVSESKTLLDLVATDVCVAWKDVLHNHSTKDVNAAIEKARNLHADNIARINELDKEILDLFGKAKDEMADISLTFKQVMTAYSEYKDSTLNANAALDTFGYDTISDAKDSLDIALRNLFVEL